MEELRLFTQSHAVMFGDAKNKTGHVTELLFQKFVQRLKLEANNNLKSGGKGCRVSTTFLLLLVRLFCKHKVSHLQAGLEI